MENAMRNVLIFCMIASISGCATTTIEGDGQKTPQSKLGTHTVHSSFYGFNWVTPPPTKKECDQGRGLYRVRNHTNAVYVFVSVISLGLYVPQTLEWWCDATPDPTDDEEIYVPES